MQNVLSRMDMALPQNVIKMTVLSPLHRGTFFVNQVSVYDESAAGRSSLFQCTPTHTHLGLKAPASSCTEPRLSTRKLFPCQMLLLGDVKTWGLLRKNSYL